jgi:signal peptidase II
VLVGTAVLVFLVVIDQVTKFFAWNSSETSFLGMSISPFKNYFFFLSSFQDLSMGIRSLVACLSFFVLISFVYLCSSFFGSYSRWIRWGSIFLVAGQVGNNLDRVQIGYVRDFIVLPLKRNIVFNVADVFIAGGLILFMAGLIQAARQMTGQKNRRYSFLVNPSRQLQVIGPLMGFILLSLCSPILFLGLFFHLQPNFSEDPSAMSALWIGLFSFFVLSILWGFVMALKWSYQILGPIYAFRRWWRAHAAQEIDQPLKLRKGDLVIELEELSREVMSSQGK